jgi:IS30 family transposase
MVSYIDQQWQADLVDMQKFEKNNNHYKYILTVIDIFSRFAWVKPLKSKRGDEVTDVFTKIFKKNKPVNIQFDDGKEFYNKHFKELLEKNNIEWFSTYSDKKAAVVERFNITLKEKVFYGKLNP